MTRVPLLPASSTPDPRYDTAPSVIRLPLDEAIALAASRVRPEPRPGGAFTIDIDEHGGAIVDATDLPALARLRMMLRECETGDSADVGRQWLRQESAFAWRGVMECFYGDLWDPRSRHAVIEAAAAQGANSYVYGPAADELTGSVWQKHYTGAAAETLAALTEQAARQGIRSLWRCSPSAPLAPRNAIRPSDDGDISALLSKVESVLALGFDGVLIAFDDIENGLDAVSAAAFAHDENALAFAHASVINRISAVVGPERVVACPTHYWGSDSSPYRTRFGQVLGQGIAVCWTGNAVIPSEISTEDAQRVAGELAHPLWLWDNYPVNDWDVEAMTATYFDGVEGLGNAVTPRRLPLAPLTGRQGSLGEAADAYFANAAIGAVTGLPALRTAMDFAWLGKAYDVQERWRRALEATGAPVSSLEIVADAVGPVSGGPARVPSRLARACGRVLTADAVGQDEAIAALALEVDAHVRALNDVKAHPSDFVTAIQPWLYDLARQCTLASLAVSALRSEKVEMARWSNALDHALQARSMTVVASDAARAVALFARGVVAGGSPEIPS